MIATNAAQTKASDIALRSTCDKQQRQSGLKQHEGFLWVNPDALLSPAEGHDLSLYMQQDTNKHEETCKSAPSGQNPEASVTTSNAKWTA